MPSRKPDLTDLIYVAVKEMTARRQSRTNAAQWVMVVHVADKLGLDEATVQTAARKAADEGRLAIEGDPVSRAVKEHPAGLTELTVLCTTGQPCARIYQSDRFATLGR